MSTPRGTVASEVAKDYAERIVVTDSSLEPQIPTVITVPVPDAATGDIDLVLATKFEVIDVICQKQGGAGAGNTVTVKNGANAISDAIACATDTAITRAGTINDANSTIAAGGTLRLSCTRAAGTRNSLVTIVGLVRA
jgi:hypothetical protein